MVTVSLLTACHPDKLEHLPEAAASVARARGELGSRGIELEWLLCFDGPLSEEIVVPEADELLVLPRHVGVAAARNLLLPRCRGSYLAILDADDVLVSDGLVRAVELMEAQGGIGWVACNRTFMDGTPTPYWHRPNSWGPRYLAFDWTAPFVFHPATIVIRTAIAWEHGGWPALSACEDLAFILRVSEHHGGRAISEVLLKYRVWEKQTLRSEGFAVEELIAHSYIENLLNTERERTRNPLIAAPSLEALRTARLAH